MTNYLEPHDAPEKRAAMAAFAKLIPDRADHPNAAYLYAIRSALERWEIPALVVWPDGDMAWKPDEGERIARLMPCAEFYLIRNAGHYVQEDAGEELTQRVLRFLREQELVSERSLGRQTKSRAHHA